MKNKIKYYKIRVVVLVLLTTFTIACTDDFDKLNIPSNRIALEDAGLVELGAAFAQAQYHGIRIWYQGGHNLFAGTWTQYYTTIHPNFPNANFVEVGFWSELLFTGFYGRTGFGAGANQLNFVEKFTAENDMEVENALAKAWRVYLYHRITDFWGPIIYSEFGNGETSVAYDSQEDIYHDFFKTLDEVVAVFKDNTDARPFGRDDLVYGGNVEQYLKWVNSTRLRLAMRIAYIEPTLAQQEAEKALNSPGGVIIDNSDNALLTSTINNVNKLSSITYHTEFVMSATMQSIMVGYNDPRISLYIQPCCGRLQQFEGEGFIGLRNGLPPGQRSTDLAQTNSFPGSSWLPIANGGTNEPDILIEASEVYFLRAEGALRGWNMGGTAKQLYNEGIRASLEHRINASDAVVDAYITSTNIPVAPTTSTGDPDSFNSPPVTDIPVVYQESGDFETQLEQIITQKWLALFPMNDWEAWAERRRTGYPRGYAIIESLNPRISETELVRRLKLIPGEFSNNLIAVEAAQLLLNGPDENDTRVWWDAKPLEDFPTPTDPQ